MRGKGQDAGEGARAKSHRAYEATEKALDLNLNEGQATGDLNGVIFQLNECYENHPRRYYVLGKCFSSCCCFLMPV